MKNQRSQHLVLWDGDCGFCRRCVQWLEHRDKGRVLEFEPYQKAEISPELKKACERAIHVLTSDGRVLRAGRAFLFTLRATKWRKIAKILGYIPLIWAVEIGYWIVARNRGLFSRLLFFIR